MNILNQPIISAIVAMSENRVIGNNNRLPWHLPADLTHFKNITTGHPVIMGRKTYDAIGKPLPNRTNIIISRNQTFQVPACISMTSAHEAIQYASTCEGKNEIFIIGGSEIYKLCMPYVKQIYITIVHHVFEGDAYFPELNSQEWHEIKRETRLADDKNIYSYSFIVMQRL